MKKSTHNYIFNYQRGFVEEPHSDHIDKWAVCNCVALKLPDLYEIPMSAKILSPHFITRMLEMDNQGFTEFKTIEPVYWEQMLKMRKKVILSVPDTNMYGYDSLLVKLFEYQKCRFEVNLRSYLLYVYDDTDELIGIILPIKMTKEVIEYENEL